LYKSLHIETSWKSYFLQNIIQKNPSTLKKTENVFARGCFPCKNLVTFCWKMKELEGGKNLSESFLATKIKRSRVRNKLIRVQNHPDLARCSGFSEIVPDLFGTSGFLNCSFFLKLAKNCSLYFQQKKIEKNSPKKFSAKKLETFSFQ